MQPQYLTVTATGGARPLWKSAIVGWISFENFSKKIGSSSHLSSMDRIS